MLGPRVLVACGMAIALLAGVAAHPALGAPPADRGQSNRAAGDGTDQPPIPVDTSGCTTLVLGQPFSWARDHNWYTLVAGQSPGGFDGAGWTLSNGAKVVTAAVKDGQTSSVL